MILDKLQKWLDRRELVYCREQICLLQKQLNQTHTQNDSLKESNERLEKRNSDWANKYNKALFRIEELKGMYDK